MGKRFVKWLKGTYLALILLFLYSPIAVMIALSFNAGKSRAKWEGFSFKWYVELFTNNPDILQALRLTVEVAQKAKNEGVGQFLFLSTESVYGLHAPVGKTVTITKDTPLHPVDNYGISKAKAEEGLAALRDEYFKVAILRPPMIYGKDCKGNYQTLSKLAKKLPVFPLVENQRSMLYIDNLCEFIRLLVEDGADGLYCPQNAEYVSTSDMVSRIAHANGHGLLMVRGLGWALKLLAPMTGMVDKAFGSLCYDRALSEYTKSYCVKTFDESILETEGVSQ